VQAFCRDVFLLIVDGYPNIVFFGVATVGPKVECVYCLPLLCHTSYGEIKVFKSRVVPFFRTRRIKNEITFFATVSLKEERNLPYVANKASV